jgi:hypothetical protein
MFNPYSDIPKRRKRKSLELPDPNTPYVRKPKVPGKEAANQSQIVQYLRINGCYVEVTDSGEVARFTRGQVKKGLLPAGTFDLTVIRESVGFKLETKRSKGGVVSEKQKQMKIYLDSLNVPNLIVTNLEDLIVWLKKTFPQLHWMEVRQF